MPITLTELPESNSSPFKNTTPLDLQKILQAVCETDEGSEMVRKVLSNLVKKLEQDKEQFATEIDYLESFLGGPNVALSYCLKKYKKEVPCGHEETLYFHTHVVSQSLLTSNNFGEKLEDLSMSVEQNQHPAFIPQLLGQSILYHLGAFLREQGYRFLSELQDLTPESLQEFLVDNSNTR